MIQASAEGYPASWVANSVLRWHNERGKKISHLKLQKLVYCVHGWSLAILGRPAVSSPFGVWQYGPVSEGLFHQFKHFGSSYIDEYAKVPMALPESDGILFIDDDEKLKRVLEDVLDIYSPFSATQLSALTHREGTPWSTAKQEGRMLIDNDRIKEHYETLAKRGS